MERSLTGRLKRSLPDFGLYVVTGLVSFTIVRVALSEYGLVGWWATLVSLGVMLVVLEVLTRVGWLANPLSEEGGERE